MRFLFLTLLFMLTAAEAAAPSEKAAFDGEIVRLHVIANSDSETDQRLKLRVRDAVLRAAGEEISAAATALDLNEAVKSRMDILEKAAETTVQEEGFDYDVSLQFGVFDFPAKTYSGVTYPAGRYNAVRVIIGEGAGKNWWCVLFPPLCFTEETMKTTSANLTEPEFKAKFKILEIFS